MRQEKPTRIASHLLKPETKTLIHKNGNTKGLADMTTIHMDNAHDMRLGTAYHAASYAGDVTPFTVCEATNRLPAQTESMGATPVIFRIAAHVCASVALFFTTLWILSGVN